MRRKKAYGEILGIKNNCLSESDKVYVELYYQYKDDKILLSKNVETTLKNIIEQEKVEEDLLNLISWLFEKIENFKDSDLGLLWMETYGGKDD